MAALSHEKAREAQAKSETRNANGEGRAVEGASRDLVPSTMPQSFPGKHALAVAQTGSLLGRGLAIRSADEPSAKPQISSLRYGGQD
jgi:hypothetical protein